MRGNESFGREGRGGIVEKSGGSGFLLKEVMGCEDFELLFKMKFEELFGNLVFGDWEFFYFLKFAISNNDLKPGFFEARIVRFARSFLFQLSSRFFFKVCRVCSNK